MIAVGNVLRRWRESLSSFRVLTPDGANFTVCLVTDRDSQAKKTLKSVLDVQLGPSETNAVVPFHVTETLETTLDAEVLGKAVAILDAALSGVPYLTDPVAQIHFHVRSGAVRWTGEGGIVTKAVLDWEGTASYFPARSAS